MAWVERGRIQAGAIVFPQPLSLPEGTEVEVRPLKKQKHATRARKTKESPRSLADRLRSVISKARNLPPDASVNHDYYLYGLPKSE